MEDQNPWWFGDTHFVYENWLNKEVKWVPDTIAEMESKPFSLNFIIGPRQVGKTTLIMLYIHRELLKKIDSRSIFYYSCDELTDFEELGEVLDNYLSFRDIAGVSGSYIFLDEITFVEDWWRAIKSRIDAGKLRRDVLYVSGSASIELLAQKERFPGRRGEGKDIYLLPLTFNEVERLVFKRPINESRFTSEVDKVVETNRVLKETIEKDFEKYLNMGGFPLAIIETLTKGRSLEAERSYLDWIKSDIIKIGKDEKTAKEILSTIIKSRNTPLSWLEISRETGISSPNTVKSYVRTLENLFILKTLEHIEPDGKIKTRKNKKIHITDPFIYKTIARWTRTETYIEDIVESAVATHLSRIGETYYWRNKTEIDIVLKTNRKLIGFKVKWGPKPRPKRRPIKTITLTKQTIPLYLATIKWPNKIQ